jgi:thiol-disulfide isomerase/thioredoxin
MIRPASVLTVAAVAAAVVVALTTAFVVSPALRQSAGLTPAQEGYRIGGYVDLPADWLQDSRFTVVLFLRQSCPSCQAAVPALRQLVSNAQSRGVRVRVVISRSAPNLDRQFAHQLGVPAEHVHEADVASLALTHVPTVLVALPDRRITFHVSRTVTSTDVEALFRSISESPH